ncbi:hypothetical protein HW555_008388, partial [Spodoptera exigua]
MIRKCNCSNYFIYSLVEQIAILSIQRKIAKTWVRFQGPGRRQKKKVMQVIIPLLFGMKSAGMAMFAMAIVTVLTLKAFLASKVALLVTVGMAVKKLYETYGSGVGLQNHPYLYSQYPIDFPSASSHAYSVSGVSPQFASPEMYSPTAMGAHGQTNEIIHQSDASAQQSQQAPTLLVNSTRAEQRWDVLAWGLCNKVHFIGYFVE